MTLSVLFVIGLTAIVTCFIHETGHALAGLILYKGKISVYLGSYGDARKALHLKVGRIEYYCKYNLFLWRRGLCVAEQQESSWAKSFIHTLAGPLATFILSGIYLYLLISPQVMGLIKFIAVFGFLIALVDVLTNLNPKEKAVVLFNGSLADNDGQNLKYLLKSRHTHDHLILLANYYTQERILEGIHYFDKVYARSKDADIIRAGISFYFKAEYYGKVLDLYKDLEMLEALNSDDYCYYALSYSHIGEHQKSLLLYNLSLEGNPSHFFALINRGCTFTIIENYSQALTDFNNALQIDPNYSYAFSNRGLAKIKLGLEQEGLADLYQALALDENDSYGYKNLGIYYLDKGEIGKAVELFNKAATIDPKTNGLQELFMKLKKESKTGI